MERVAARRDSSSFAPGRSLFDSHSRNLFKPLHLQLFLDRDRNHVVTFALIFSHHSRHSPLQSHHCVPRSKPRPASSAPANHHKISVIPFVLIFFRTLLHSRKTQLFYFHAIPNSLRKTPGGGGYFLSADVQTFKRWDLQTCKRSLANSFRMNTCKVYQNKGL